LGNALENLKRLATLEWSIFAWRFPGSNLQKKWPPVETGSLNCYNCLNSITKIIIGSVRKNKNYLNLDNYNVKAQLRRGHDGWIVGGNG